MCTAGGVKRVQPAAIMFCGGVKSDLPQERHTRIKNMVTSSSISSSPSHLSLSSELWPPFHHPTSFQLLFPFINCSSAFFLLLSIVSPLSSTSSFLSGFCFPPRLSHLLLGHHVLLREITVLYQTDISHLSAMCSTLSVCMCVFVLMHIRVCARFWMTGRLRLTCIKD